MNIKSKFSINNLLKNAAICGLVFLPFVQSNAMNGFPGMPDEDFFNMGKRDFSHSREDINKLTRSIINAFGNRGRAVKMFARTPIGKIISAGTAAATLGLTLFLKRDSIKNEFNNISNVFNDPDLNAEFDDALNNVLDKAQMMINNIKTKNTVRNLKLLMKNNIIKAMDELSEQIKENKISQEDAIKEITNLVYAEISTLYKKVNEIIENNKSNLDLERLGLDVETGRAEAGMSRFIHSIWFGDLSKYNESSKFGDLSGLRDSSEFE